MKNDLINKILIEKKRKNALILAHYYVDSKIQEIADYVGDSYYLSKVAAKSSENFIIFCGVTFMGESAKILSPHKRIIMPSLTSICPMAEMITVSEIEKVKESFDDVQVVAYINSSSHVKKYVDVCVTSSNALTIINSLSSKNIFFIPDKNLGHYLSTKIKNKNFIFNNGYCPIHHSILKKDIIASKLLHPDALVLAHPECRAEVLLVSDFVGSTSEIINFATNSSASEFIIATESGVLSKLTALNKDKHFYLPTDFQICPNMKKITLENLYDSLINPDNHEIFLDDDTLSLSKKPLEKMHLLGK